MPNLDLSLQEAFEAVSKNSGSRLSFQALTTREFAESTGLSVSRSPNRIYEFTLRAEQEQLRAIAYTLTLDGTGRVATRAEALARGIASSNGRLFEFNPLLLIYDYVGKRLLAVSAARLFNAFAEEVNSRSIAVAPTATFSLTPSFQNRTISMYATLGEPITWFYSLREQSLTLDSVIGLVSKMRADTQMFSSRLPAIVAAIKARLSIPVSITNEVPSEQTRPDQAVPAEDQIEGIDITLGSSGWGDYPLDAVFVRTEARSVSEVTRRIEAKRYVLDPEFQREFVWPPAKQSKLIESCVMRIPLPVFYVAEAPDGRIIVVDGLQRLGTFARFLNNELKLTGLSGSENPDHPLEGRYFKDLPLNLQERVQDTQLTMYILDAKAPERARLDIFERVNSGEPLTRQQMRNALYNGSGTRWLKHVAASTEFQQATGGSFNQKTMRDREAINRFCAFKLLGWEYYSTGDMDGFLAEGLVALTHLLESERMLLEQAFVRSMTLNRQLFEEHAFRKSLAAQSSHADRSVINISLFEVCSVALASEKIAGASVETLGNIREQIVALVRSEDFARSITYSTNSTAAVQKRFASMDSLIEKVLANDSAH